MCAEEGSEEKINKEGTSEGTLSDRKIGGVLMSVCINHVSERQLYS